MRTARLLAVSGLFVATTGFTLFGNSEEAFAVKQSDSVAVARIVAEFHRALSEGDSSRALGLLADDATIIESGAVESRSQYRSHHMADDIQFAKAVITKRSPLQIRIRGASAWTAGTSTSRGKFKGKAIDSAGAESMVLTKDAAGWRIRSIHWSSHKRGSST
jgi:ketosteroid isomerase-like protein